MKRPYRVVVAKPGLDGHDRGAKVIARALRDAGFEVVYTGLHQTPEQVVSAVVQEDADAVGLSLLSGAHLTLVPRVIEAAGRARAATTCWSSSGGIIPEADIPGLKAMGVAEVFTPGAPLPVDRPVAGRGARPARGGPRGLSRRSGSAALTRARAGVAEPAPTRRPATPDRTTAHAATHTTHQTRSTTAAATRRQDSGGSLRVPGQAVLRPLRHPHLRRRRGRHGRRGGGRRPTRPATRWWSRPR